MTVTDDDTQRAALRATAMLTQHPERNALARLYDMLAACLIPVFVALLLCIPAAVWWAYDMAIQ